MYEYLMNMSDECCLKAIYAYRKKDVDMARFWKNASIALKKRALKLNIDEKI